MRLVLGDITNMGTDAIVNAASSDLRPCPGICSAVFAAADSEKLLAACRKIGRCDIGKAVVTPSFGLPCKYIIHVAGVGWYSGRHNEKMLFADCYRHAFYKKHIPITVKVSLYRSCFRGTFIFPVQRQLRS